MNHYEEKQEAKRERYLELAEKNRERSEIRYQESKQLSGMIPFGQPILVGHHSEKGHRRHIDKIHNNMRKSIELGEKADYYEARAENMSNAISSDDPDAIEKLKTKLAKLEDRQQDMKEQNAEARANKTDKPFESYQLSNNNGNIRNVKQRILRLEKAKQTKPKEDVEGDGYVLHEDKEENRIQFLFEGKPGEEVRRLLKTHGFRWLPNNKAWQRQITQQARFTAEYLTKLPEFKN